MSDGANIDAYFERIGFSGSIAPSLQTLEALHQLHPAAIPFENLDTLMQVPIRLELRNLEQKLLFEKRGGYCFEHNLLFKAMLEDLGFAVRGLAARVLWGRDAAHAEQPESHMVLLVEVNGTDYLADVGFGGLTLTAPLRLRADAEQTTPHETFRLTGGEDGWQLEARLGGAWQALYAFGLAEKTLDDYVALNDAVAGESLWRETLIAARSERSRRISLHNTELRIHPTGGDTEARTLAGVGEVKEVLAGFFGIALPPAERLDPALERALSGMATTA